MQFAESVFRNRDLPYLRTQRTVSDLASNHEKQLSVEVPNKRILSYATRVRGPCFNQIEQLLALAYTGAVAYADTD